MQDCGNSFANTLELLLSCTKPLICCCVFQEQLVRQLIEAPEKGTDLDERVLSAYIHQFTAEAQEG